MTGTRQTSSSGAGVELPSHLDAVLTGYWSLNSCLGNGQPKSTSGRLGHTWGLVYFEPEWRFTSLHTGKQLMFSLISASFAKCPDSLEATNASFTFLKGLFGHG